MFLVRFACHTAKKNKKEEKKNIKNEQEEEEKKKKTTEKILAVKNKNSRFSRSLWFKPISAKAIEEIVDNFCSFS